MFHANFHGDFFNLSKTARQPGPPRAFSGVAPPGRCGLLRRRLYQLRPRAPSSALSFFSPCLLHSEDPCHMMASSGPIFLLILSSSLSCLAYQRRFAGHRAGTPHIKSSARSPPPRSFASLFLRDAGDGWGSLITRSVVKRHMLALKDI